MNSKMVKVEQGIGVRIRASACLMRQPRHEHICLKGQCREAMTLEKYLVVELVVHTVDE